MEQYQSIIQEKKDVGLYLLSAVRTLALLDCPLLLTVFNFKKKTCCLAWTIKVGKLGDTDFYRMRLVEMQRKTKISQCTLMSTFAYLKTIKNRCNIVVMTTVK